MVLILHSLVIINFWLFGGTRVGGLFWGILVFHFLLSDQPLTLSLFLLLASLVELWNKHQEVKKQKALEKQSKEMMKRRN